MTHANHALIRSSNQPVLSNEDKVSRKKTLYSRYSYVCSFEFFCCFDVQNDGGYICELESKEKDVRWLLEQIARTEKVIMIHS